MQLEVQSLLRQHGLEHVKDFLKLEVKEKDGLVLLKYNQIEADWTKNIATENKHTYYNNIKKLIINKIDNNISSAQIVKEIKKENNIAFQTIYKFINEYKNA